MTLQQKVIRKSTSRVKEPDSLRVFEVMDNKISDIIFSGFTELKSPRVVAMSWNFHQGPTPKFNSMVHVNMS